MKNSNLSELQFVCPNCKDALAYGESSLECRRCNVDYPIRDGIIHFSDKDYYFSDIPNEKMKECLEIAEACGWRSALFDYFRKIDFWIYRIAADESRVDWRLFLPVHRDSTVLDWGCGFGIASIALAQTCRHIVALDSSYERIRLLAIRKRQEGISNIHLVRGAFLEVPFPDNYFDAIILNGVLEWFGQTSNHLLPLEAQKGALRSAFHSLKQGGVLYIGIENRFGYNYFLGSRDHNGLRFTSLMPRCVADIYSLMLRKERYRILTHSYWKYKRVLHEVGFSQIEM